MSAQLAAPWINFFGTAAEAAATLAGLVMVAISVNVQRIIAFRHLPLRAGVTIAALVLNLIASRAALIPQPLFALGVEILVFALIVWVWLVWVSRRIIASRGEHQRPVAEILFGIVAGQLQAFPFVIGGVLLLAGEAGGAYWIAAGIIATFVFSVLNAWVLLVEILR